MAAAKEDCFSPARNASHNNTSCKRCTDSLENNVEISLEDLWLNLNCPSSGIRQMRKIFRSHWYSQRLTNKARYLVKCNNSHPKAADLCTTRHHALNFVALDAGPKKT